MKQGKSETRQDTWMRIGETRQNTWMRIGKPLGLYTSMVASPSKDNLTGSYLSKKAKKEKYNGWFRK